jgi:hypothetical protein
MSDDLLERATRALREAGSAPPDEARAANVRRQMLSRVERRSRFSPRGFWQWAAVLLASLFVSTAMAHVIRVQLPRVIEALRVHAPSATPSPRPAAVPRSKSPAHPPEPAAPPVAPEPAVVAPAPPEVVVPAAQETAPSVATQGPAAPAPSAPGVAPTSAPRPRVAAQPKVVRVAPAPAVAVAPAESKDAPTPQAPPVPAPTETKAADSEPIAARPAPTPRPTPESAEVALFRRAQRLHNARDPEAIAAWDAYLRVATTGALVPEARYNRALALIRANRFSQARRALEPFASGQYGTYRKQEAQQLLSRLPQ